MAPGGTVEIEGRVNDGQEAEQGKGTLWYYVGTVGNMPQFIYGPPRDPDAPQRLRNPSGVAVRFRDCFSSAFSAAFPDCGSVTLVLFAEVEDVQRQVVGFAGRTPKVPLDARHLLKAKLFDCFNGGCLRARHDLSFEALDSGRLGNLDQLGSML